MSAEGYDEKTTRIPVLDEKLPTSPRTVVNVTSNVNAKLSNPLAGLSHEQLMNDGAQFAQSHGLGHLEETFKKGAIAAQDPLAFETVSYFTEEEKEIFRRELTHRWDHPATLYYLAILCSVAAAVQGVSSLALSGIDHFNLSNQMDEAVINGANLFYAKQFGIDPSEGDKGRNQWLLGLVNSSPYVYVLITSSMRSY
jgi:hypothetical protein